MVLVWAGMEILAVMSASLAVADAAAPGATITMGQNKY